MKESSVIYKMIRALGTGKYEVRIVHNATIYEHDKIKSITVHPSLTTGNGISLGGTNSTECRMTIVEQSSNWERMAAFLVEFRLVAGSRASTWIPFGKFYTDERSEDDQGNLSIVAYDKMLQMEQTWADKIPTELLPPSYPITARAWAVMLQSAGVVDFADVTQLNDSLTFIGLDTTATVRDVLKDIASAHGGNWVMETVKSGTSVVERLNLKQFTDPPESQSAYTTLGMSVKTFENSPPLSPVTGVHLETESGTAIEAGTDTGYRVSGKCEFTNSDGIADLCLGRLSQYVYKPFAVTSAHLDPVTDVGDYVSINNTMYQVMSIDWNLTQMPLAKVSAPYDQEVDHEYAVVDTETKNYRKTMAMVNDKMSDYVPWESMSTAIVQNSESVVIAAQGTYVKQTDYDREIAEIQAQLDGSIQTWSGDYVPTLSNEPAVEWTTSTDKAEHVGDLFFINSGAGIPEAGLYYRFENNNGVYSWALLSDSAAAEALSKAGQALAAAESAEETATDANTTAQMKGRIWVTTPVPPYNQGDLWFKDRATEIKVCMTPKAEGQSFSESDWVKRDKYTDDSQFTTWLNTYNQTIQAIQSQIDKKAETYYQNADPAVEWLNVHPVGIAVAGVDVVGVPHDIALIHEGDLWYRTTDHTTWFFDGVRWAQQDVPDEVFDKIDGKAQVFVSTPYTPYFIGDLWFNGTEDDIKTCIRDRSEGAYIGSDWVKYNKYTDDSAFEEWTTEVYTADLEVTNRSISARVQKDQSGTRTDFGWLLNETAHTWYSNNQEVMKVNSSGLTVTGNITAKTGYIGNGQSGFEIGDTYIRNGMTSLTDTSHNGVFIGVGSSGGIALGAGNFKVTHQGVLTAKSGKIGSDSSAWNIGAKSIYNGLSSLTGTTAGTYVGIDGIAIYKDAKNNFKVQQSTGRLTLLSGMTGRDDETNTTGMYIGYDGISLGGGRFKVTNAGAATAKNLSIKGGTIEIRDANNNVAFNVSSVGAVTAKNLALTGGSISLKDANNNVAFSVTTTGQLTAKSGTVGGFTLSSNAIYTSGQSTYDGTGNGIYIGSSGLRIGSKFSVDNEGNLRASGAQFEGNIYAKNILYSQTDSTKGTLSGDALTRGTVTGGVDNYGRATGGLASSTVAVGNTVGMSSSLAYGDQFGLAIAQNTGDYPPYFTCGTLTAKSGITSNGNVMASSNTVQGNIVQGNTLKVYYGSSSTGGWKDIGDHTHDFEVSGGQVTIKKADWTGAAHSFNIADTQYYKDGVSASGEALTTNATSLRDFDSAFDVDLTGSGKLYTPSGTTDQFGRVAIKNSSGTTLKKLRVRVPAGGGGGSAGIQSVTGLTTSSSDWTTYDYAVGLGSSSVYTNGSTQYGRVKINLTDGTNKTLRVGMPAGSTGTVASITSSYQNDYEWNYSTGHWNLRVYAKDSNNVTIKDDLVDVQFAVDYGASQGGGTMTWDIYQHYDMGEPDGWDCRVTCGDQSHTFWSASRIYQ